MGFDAEKISNLYDTIAKSTLVGFVGQPQDIANTVAFLASSDAKFITGTILVDDGGAILS